MTHAPGDTEINKHIGDRMRTRRKLLGKTQENLAEALGLTFQQIQKYEKGTNSVSAPRLLQLAQALDVPVSFFFDGLGEGGAAHPEDAVSITDIRTARDIAGMDPTVRDAFRSLARTLKPARQNVAA